MGEEIAREFLVSAGYRIEAVNWKKSRFEIDIVASKGGLLAFIEVKSSRKDLLGPPELRVNKNKQKRIAEAASEYLAGIETLPEDIRFDVISVLWNEDDAPEITHIESAFQLDQD